jgi:hypothetical protein
MCSMPYLVGFGSSPFLIICKCSISKCGLDVSSMFVEFVFASTTFFLLSNGTINFFFPFIKNKDYLLEHIVPLVA